MSKSPSSINLKFVKGNLLEYQCTCQMDGVLADHTPSIACIANAVECGNHRDLL